MPVSWTTKSVYLWKWNTNTVSSLVSLPVQLVFFQWQLQVDIFHFSRVWLPQLKTQISKSRLVLDFLLCTRNQLPDQRTHLFPFSISVYSSRPILFLYTSSTLCIICFNYGSPSLLRLIVICSVTRILHLIPFEEFHIHYSTISPRYHYFLFTFIIFFRHIYLV